MLSFCMQTYDGMIVGEHSRDTDLDVRKLCILETLIILLVDNVLMSFSDLGNHRQQVNPVRTKELTNIRAPGKDENVRLTPPRLVCFLDMLYIYKLFFTSENSELMQSD